MARAIGYARNASILATRARIALLKKAADDFRHSAADVEHAVRMLGMPIRLIREHFESIPDILRGIAGGFACRFKRLEQDHGYWSTLVGNMQRQHQPQPGFCYVVTPGNDVRAGAMVAANLVVLGIPFIIKPSREDCATALTIAALLKAGIDPRFCSLAPFDSGAPRRN